jgi:hypothetical protein
LAGVVMHGYLFKSHLLTGRLTPGWQIGDD